VAPHPRPRLHHRPYGLGRGRCTIVGPARAGFAAFRGAAARSHALLDSGVPPAVRPPPHRRAPQDRGAAYAVCAGTPRRRRHMDLGHTGTCMSLATRAHRRPDIADESHRVASLGLPCAVPTRPLGVAFATCRVGYRPAHCRPAHGRPFSRWEVDIAEHLASVPQRGWGTPGRGGGGNVAAHRSSSGARTCFL